VSLVISVHRRNWPYPESFGVVLLFLAYHLAAIALLKPAVDLGLRVVEARYVRARIDPFLVMTGVEPQLDSIGGTFAYSFVSYLLMLPLTFLDSHVTREIIFVVLEATLLAMSLVMVRLLAGSTPRRMFVALAVCLFGSVFFLQHVQNLNYSVTGAVAATLVFGSERLMRPRSQTMLGALGLVLLAVKPSFAIPVVLVLIARRRWSVLVTGGSVLVLGLLTLSLWLDRNPIVLLLNTSATAERFNSGYENGLLFLFWRFVDPVALPASIIVTAVVVLLARRQVQDPVVALSVSLALGIALFFNQVHAWIAVFPLVMVAAVWSTENKDARRSMLLLLAFALVPRLLGAVPLEYRDAFMAVHNLVRFSILLAGVFLLARAAQVVTTALDAAPRSRMDGNCSTV
jgi:hypothetical protein